MATKPRTTMGTMACLCCGHDIPVKQSENGTMNLSCSWCDFTGYVKSGTEAHRVIGGKVKGKAEPAPVAKPETVHKRVLIPQPTPAPAPAPAPRARNSVFDL